MAVSLDIERRQHPLKLTGYVASQATKIYIYLKLGETPIIWTIHKDCVHVQEYLSFYDIFKKLCLITNKNQVFKYHVFAPMGRLKLELIYLYFPPSIHLTVRWKDGGK